MTIKLFMMIAMSKMSNVYTGREMILYNRRRHANPSIACTSYL